MSTANAFLWKGLALVLLVIVVPGTTVQAQKTQGAESGGTEASCFHCYTGQTGDMGCYQDEHRDQIQPQPGGDLKGFAHLNTCVTYTCWDWLNSASHQYYNETLELDVEAAALSLEDGSDGALFKVVREHSQVRVNAQRSAIQVVDLRTGQVVLNEPIPPEQAHRLQSRLDSEKADRSR